MRMLSGLDGTSEFIFISSGNGVVGWARKDLSTHWFEELIRDPEVFFADRSSQILKDGHKTKVIKRTFADPTGISQGVVIKRFHYPSLFRRIGFFFLPSPAARCLRGALMLRKGGIQTPTPLAAVGYRSWKSLGTSYYVAEDVQGSRSLRIFWRDILAPLPKEESRVRKREVLSGLALLFYRLHASGIYHRDLKGGNVLIRGHDVGNLQFFLVDLDRVWRRRSLSWSRRIKNLFQLYRTLSTHVNEREMVFFVKRYADLFSLSRDKRKALAKRVLAVSRKSA